MPLDIMDILEHTRLEELAATERTRQDLLERSYMVGLVPGDRKMFDSFLYKSGMTYDSMITYAYLSEWGQATSNYRHRYMLIDFPDGDIVLVLMKFVEVGAGFYLRIYFRPMSRNDNAEHELDTLQLLSTFSYPLRYCLSVDGDKNAAHQNYYNVLTEDFAYYNRSAWRSGKGVNKLRPDLTLTTDHEDFNALIALATKWTTLRKLKASIKADKSLLLMSPPQVETYKLYYKGKLVGYQTIIFSKDGKVANCALMKHLCIGDEQSIIDQGFATYHPEAHKLRKYLGYVFVFLVEEALLARGVEAFYIDGNTPGEHLDQFKERVFKRVIYYRDNPISEVIADYEAYRSRCFVNKNLRKKDES